MNNSNNSALLSSPPKISVIIPVYNSSEFLSECLNSLLTQTLDNIEIICVDDGSTDNSPEILKKYSEKDHRIKILKQKNQFAGTARNNGLATASGEYLLFMDSDDFCDSRLLEKTYNKAKSEDSDIVLFNAKKYNNRLKKAENASHYFKRNLCPAKTPFSLKDTENLLSITTTSPWSKLFKNEFIKREKIKFQSLHNANDVFFVVVSLCTARRISFVDEALIFYRTNLNNNIQSLKSKYPTCFLDAYLETYKELNRRNVYKYAEKSFVNLVISGCKYNIETIKDPNARLKIFEIITGDEFSETGILSHEESYYNNNEALNTVKGSFNALNWFNKIQNKRSTPEPVILKKSNFKAETPFVSVIVPVYNVEKYLKECLDSIINQTLKNIEIICVNDGSSDSSLDILMAYAEKDNRFTILSRKNHGLSAARNEGAKYSNGKYLYFMDSDDIIEINALEELYNKSETENLDILLFDGASFYDEENNVDMHNNLNYYNRNNEYSEICTGISMMEKMVSAGEYRTSLCLQFFNKNFYEKTNLKFISGIIHEDNAFTFSALVNAKRTSHINKQFFKRRLRADSIMTKNENFDNAYGYFVSFLNMKTLFETKFSDCDNHNIQITILNRALHNAIRIYLSLSTREKCCSLLMPMYEQVQFDWYIKDFCDAKNSFNVTNEKLQITYKEKFDRGIEIKNLKSEIKVLNKELKENSKLLNNKYFKRFFKIYNFLKKIIKRK